MVPRLKGLIRSLGDPMDWGADSGLAVYPTSADQARNSKVDLYSWIKVSTVRSLKFLPRTR